jgi:lipid-A-disaccharide synthase
LILRRHRAFVRIFAASEDLAAHLRVHGVPAEKITVTGDPRVDAVLGGPHPLRDGLLPQRRALEISTLSAGRAYGGEERVAILAGSRDRYFRTLVPYFMRAASAIATRRPNVTFHLITAEFLSPDVITAMQEEVRQQWPTLRIVWVREDPWEALARADLTLTIPGTNTVELAILGVPFAVIVPIELLDRVPAEGLLEYVGRLPGLGRLIKREAARRFFARPRLLALPNLRAGHAIVPEWIGRWTPSELANRVGELLDDAPRRAAMQRALREVYPATGGAAAAIASEALALARTRKVERV